MKQFKPDTIPGGGLLESMLRKEGNVYLFDSVEAAKSFQQLWGLNYGH